MRYTVSEIAEGMGATILQGDGNRTVSAWTFSSKEGNEDTMFVPMKGERVDAHDFIADAYAHGVRVTTTERGEVVPGTEDMTADYHDYAFHFKGFLIGELLALAVCALAGAVVQFVL